MTGGLVRVTGSGLGCPTWPECVDGSITPTVEQPEGIHKYIEFGNRTLTSVLVVLAAATVLAVWRWAPRRAMKVRRRGRARRGVRPGRARRSHRAARAQPRDGRRALPALDGPGRGVVLPLVRPPRRRRPAAAARPTPGHPSRLGHRGRRRGRAGAGHRRHRLRPPLGGRRRAQPVRLRRAHRLLAARRPRHGLHRARRRHLARGPADRRRRRAGTGAGLAGRAGRLPRAGADRLRAVLHRTCPRRSSSRTCSGRACSSSR